MNFIQLKNRLAENEEFSIYLLEGDEDYFKRKVIELVKNKFVAELSLNYAYFNESNFSIDKLLTSLLSYPLMSEKRLTVLTEHVLTKDEINFLAPYLQTPPKDSLFIIVGNEKTELLKKIEGITVVDCSKADESTLIKWIKAKCSGNGVQIEAQVAQVIVQYCLADMTRIEIEIEKLISFAIDKSVVTIDDVNALVWQDTDYKIYEMTDYISRKKFDLALNSISDMLSKGETPQRLILSIYNYFRRLLHVSISDKTDAELSQLLSLKEYAVKKAREQSRAFKKRALKRAVDLLMDYDYMIKNGSQDQTQALWLSVFRIMVEEQ